MKRIIQLFVVGCLFLGTGLPAAAKGDATVYIDRKARMLYVLNQNGNVTQKFPCGIGRGGLRKKANMKDHVTPTGDFRVDIVLYRDERYAAVADEVKKRYATGEYTGFFQNTGGLARLFQNMNSLDFDGDGRPDRAYGIGYAGLTSADAITGPKMEKYGGSPYWFSIGIHGTPDETSVGKAVSGGCIHLRADDLGWLIENRALAVGTKVIIGNQPFHAPGA